MTEWTRDPACREVVELVTEYLEGAMPAERVDLFEQHLMWCEGCDVYLEQMRRSIALTGRLGEDDVDPEALDRLMAAFRSWRG